LQRKLQGQDSDWDETARVSFRFSAARLWAWPLAARAQVPSSLIAIADEVIE
jgi:hypothetical protein